MIVGPLVWLGWPPCFRFSADPTDPSSSQAVPRLPTATMESGEDHGPRMLITTWSLVGLSGAFLTVRVICKLKTKRRLWWDDYVLILSWVCFHLVV